MDYIRNVKEKISNNYNSLVTDQKKEDEVKEIIVISNTVNIGQITALKIKYY